MDPTHEMPASRKVFLVHGRNLAAKNEISKFLHAIGLQPIEWDQARQQTGIPTPTTLQIVKAGLESAQAVLVLLTGDDYAQLHPAYDEEQPAPQPRPNVIFEAGWAIATAGQERTVLVSFEGPLRGFSDIDGLNYLSLDNSPAARTGLANRLRDAGCSVDAHGTTHLDAGVAGDFSNEVVVPPLKPAATTPTLEGDRGRFTEFVADSALSFSTNTIQLSKRLAADVQGSSSIEMKFHYLGPRCASHWIALSQHPEYGHGELREYISQHAEEMVTRLLGRTQTDHTPLDLISLGPGDGKIDVELLRQLEKYSQVQFYYCIDISFDLLQYAVGEVIRSPYLRREFRIKAIHGDFFELPRLAPIYTLDPSVNLFTLNGYTLGNFDETTLLKQIRAGMQEGDFLFLDARLHSLKDWDGSTLGSARRDEVAKNYMHDLNYSFAFGPVETAAQLTSDDTDFAIEIHQRHAVVPRSVRVTTKATLPNRKQPTELATTTLYDPQELMTWLPKQGFDEVWSATKSGAALVLLQRA